MMKEKFIKSTFVLLIGGLITKVLGLLIRIISTRVLGLEAISLYTLTLPAFNLFITIATLSIPVAISKIVAENVRNNKKTIFSIIPVISIFNTILVIIIILNANFISQTLLKNNELYYPIISTAFTLIFITISSIVKGYFIGKEKMFPNVLSNIFEQIVRIILIIFVIPKFLKYGTIFMVCMLILINIISETSSILILLFFLPKKFRIKKEYFRYDHSLIKEIYKISLPTTTGRLISSFAFFLEPVIITSILISLGYNTSYITKEYGIICAYIFPMVSMPQFLSNAIASALLPVISKYNRLNLKKNILKKTYLATLLSLLIAIPFTLIFTIFPKTCLNTIFAINKGSNYLKLSALLFIISYIIPPLVSAIQGIDKSKNIMYANIINMIVKLATLSILLILNFKMYSLIISTFIGYLTVIIYLFKTIKNYAK